MKNYNLKFLIAIIAIVFGTSAANGQNIIIQQNNSNNDRPTQTTTPSKPKESLGIGILKLTNNGCSTWCGITSNIITGLYLKPRGQSNYDKTNYCELLYKSSTNLPLDEGIYDIKITYKSSSGYCSGTYHDEVHGQIESKNVMIKKDYITDVIFGNKSIEIAIPRAM